VYICRVLHRASAEVWCFLIMVCFSCPVKAFLRLIFIVNTGIFKVIIYFHLERLTFLIYASIPHSQHEAASKRYTVWASGQAKVIQNTNIVNSQIAQYLMKNPCIVCTILAEVFSTGIKALYSDWYRVRRNHGECTVNGRNWNFVLGIVE